MKHYNIMIKPASSLCNLRCRYCFYADVAERREVASFGMMSSAATAGMLAQIRSALRPADSVTFAFQGGEPTLAGLDYFRRFSEIVDAWGSSVTVHYALQTNAMLLDDAWCEYLRKYDYLVGVSLDLLRDAHDAARVDAAGQGTYRPVADAVRLLKRHGVEFNVLCTLTNSLARHPAAVWKQMLALDLRYVQFTPCLADLNARERGPWALTPERFASFYIQLFPLWLRDYRAGRYRSVKLFDDVIGYLATGVPTTCDAAGECSPQLVVEADGSVYPCDFYCLDEYRLGSILEESPEALRNGERMQAFLRRPHVRAALCSDCRYLRLCGGGCKRMQREVYCAPGDTACGYRAFLDACMPELLNIARLERQYR